MGSKQILYRATVDCQRAFTECLSVPELSTNSWIDNRLGDFNLWAASLRAGEISHASLDYRLRERQDAIEVIKSLLHCLQSSLKQCQQIAVGNIDTLDDLGVDQDNDDESIGSWPEFSEDEDEADSGIGGYEYFLEPRLSEEARNVAAIIDQLTRLGMAIRRAGTRFRYRDADRLLKKEEHAELEHHLRAVLLYGREQYNFTSYASCLSPALGIVSRAFFLDPGRLTPIQKRLIHANIVRRNRFDYMRKREERLPAFSQAKPDEASIEKPKGPSTIRSTLPTPDTKQVQKSPEPSINQSATQVNSQFEPTMAPVDHAGSKVTKISTIGALAEYSKPPRVEDGRETFQCPYCLHVLPAKHAIGEGWKSHVRQDLLPYTCIFEDCAAPDELYLSTEEWMKHMHSNHSMRYWRCPFSSINDGCPSPSLLATEDEWISHMQSYHGSKNAFTIAQLQVLARTNMTFEIFPFNCPICHIPGNSDSIDHVAEHLHSFAMRALPWVTSADDGESKATAAQSAKLSTRESTGTTGTFPRVLTSYKAIPESFDALVDRLSSITKGRLPFLSHVQGIKRMLLELRNWRRDIESKAPNVLDSIQKDDGELAKKIEACFTDITLALDQGEDAFRSTGLFSSSKSATRLQNELQESVNDLIGMKGAIIVFIEELGGERYNIAATESNLTPDPTSTAKVLKSQLRKARIEDQQKKHQFYIPINAQSELIDRQTVTAILSQHISDQRALRHMIEKICTQGKALFGTLVLAKKEADIERFYTEGILDDDLPLRRRDQDNEFHLYTQDWKSVASTAHWESEHREQFHFAQSWFLAPVFEDLMHYELDSNTIVPTVPLLPQDSDLSVLSGGFSDVFFVRFHPAHVKWNVVVDTKSQGPLCAVKRLHQSDREQFERERQIHLHLSPEKDPHIISLLSTFHRNGKFHLIFPFADSNLRTYWDRRSMPDFDRDTVLWNFRQMAGIARALARIHAFVGTVNVTRRGQVDVSDSASRVKKQEEMYGRHGDIKPENLLWLQRVPGVEDPKGVVQLADFGLGRFHGRDSRSRSRASSVAFSPTYEPPECRIGTYVSQAYDMWSLGCVFLEYVTWLLYGAEEVYNFADHRSEFSPRTGIDDDNFYTITSDTTAIVRPKVIDWVRKLHEHPRSSQLIHDLLSLIMKDLIVVEPTDRIESKKLYQQLNQILMKAVKNDNEEGEKDDDYALTPVEYAADPWSS